MASTFEATIRNNSSLEYLLQLEKAFGNGQNKLRLIICVVFDFDPMAL